MFDHKHYVPILKGKEEGLRSLFEIDSATRSRLTPLVEVPSIPWDFVKDEQAKGTAEYLEVVAENLKLCWDGSRSLWVDLLLLSNAKQTGDGRHPLHFVFDEMRAHKLQAIPVTGLDRDDAFQDAAREVALQDQRGVCLRITTEDFEATHDLEAELRELLEYLKLEPSHADMVLDLGEIPATRTSLVVLVAKGILKSLPYVSDWRTLTIAASSFPASLSRLAYDEVSMAQRAEWIMWESLAKNRATIPRLPTFGDYGPSHAEFLEADLMIERSHIDLRYTTDRSWLIFKGQDSRRNGHNEFNKLCRRLVERSEYKGGTFSWGDAYVHACSTNAANAVDLTTWRMVGITHHMAFVTGQIAAFESS
jgi:hypothetical protein